MTRSIKVEPPCPVHGTRSYTRGCPGCRAYRRYLTARGRARRYAQRRINHGTRGGYDDGCRDGCCLRMRRASYPQERAAAQAKRRGAA